MLECQVTRPSPGLVFIFLTLLMHKRKLYMQKGTHGIQGQELEDAYCDQKQSCLGLKDKGWTRASSKWPGNFLFSFQLKMPAQFLQCCLQKKAGSTQLLQSVWEQRGGFLPHGWFLGANMSLNPGLVICQNKAWLSWAGLSRTLTSCWASQRAMWLKWVS